MVAFLIIKRLCYNKIRAGIKPTLPALAKCGLFVKRRIPPRIIAISKIKMNFTQKAVITPTAFFCYNRIIGMSALYFIGGVTVVYINVTIKGKIDSKELWEDVKRYDVNVTDMEQFTSVYGKVSMYDSMFIIDICRKYGDIKSEVTSI